MNITENAKTALKGIVAYKATKGIAKLSVLAAAAGGAAWLLKHRQSGAEDAGGVQDAKA